MVTTLMFLSLGKYISYIILKAVSYGTVLNVLGVLPQDLGYQMADIA